MNLILAIFVCGFLPCASNPVARAANQYSTSQSKCSNIQDRRSGLLKKIEWYGNRRASKRKELKDMKLNLKVDSEKMQQKLGKEIDNYKNEIENIELNISKLELEWKHLNCK